MNKIAASQVSLFFLPKIAGLSFDFAGVVLCTCTNQGFQVESCFSLFLSEEVENDNW